MTQEVLLFYLQVVRHEDTSLWQGFLMKFTELAGMGPSYVCLLHCSAFAVVLCCFLLYANITVMAG